MVFPSYGPDSSRYDNTISDHAGSGQLIELKMLAQNHELEAEFVAVLHGIVLVANALNDAALITGQVARLRA